MKLKAFALLLAVPFFAYAGYAATSQEKQAAKDFFTSAFKSYRAGEYARAVDQFELGLSVNPADGNGHYYLAESLRQLNRVEDALPHYRRAAELIPQKKEGIKAKAIAEREEAKLAALRKQQKEAEMQAAKLQNEQEEQKKRVALSNLFSPTHNVGVWCEYKRVERSKPNIARFYEYPRRIFMWFDGRDSYPTRVDSKQYMTAWDRLFLREPKKSSRSMHGVRVVDDRYVLEIDGIRHEWAIVNRELVHCTPKYCTYAVRKHCHDL